MRVNCFLCVSVLQSSHLAEKVRCVCAMLSEREKLRKRVDFLNAKLRTITVMIVRFSGIRRGPGSERRGDKEKPKIFKWVRFSFSHLI